MEWLAENWTLILLVVCIVIGGYVTFRKLRGLPTEEQIEAVKQWLLWAVIQAEKDLGSGTGKLKLRQVYDLFVVKFPWVAKYVSFTSFSVWVDEALIEMRKLLQTNMYVSEFVNMPKVKYDDQFYGVTSPAIVPVQGGGK